MSGRIFLSKSKIAAFEQCPKRLWLSIHMPDKAEYDAAAQATFAVGHEVGEIACASYPDGIMVAPDNNLKAALQETSELLSSGARHPIFEATFSREDVLVRVDLLLPQESGWYVAEVKSSASAKPHHLSDLATQLWVIEGSGLEVVGASIRHIDTSFVLAEPRNYTGLLRDTEAFAQTAELRATRGEVVEAAKATALGSEPNLATGDHCTNPYTCQFSSYCNAGLPAPPQYHVMLLPDAAGKKLARQLIEDGVDDLLLVEPGVMTSPKLSRVHEVTLSGVPWHDHKAISDETAAWSLPRFFLDFETIAFAVPRWVGTKPYEQVPFQFSCHVATKEGELIHHAFLSLDGEDPRRACAEALVAVLGSEGAIVAYSAGFERSCLLRLADAFPDLAEPLQAAADRLVDLLPIVRRHYYHRDMRGSWSIKAVLPTVCPDLGYDNLAVKGGGEAQLAYAEACHPDTSAERQAEIEEALLCYCERDTLAMVELLSRLSQPPIRAAPSQPPADILPTH